MFTIRFMRTWCRRSKNENSNKLQSRCSTYVVRRDSNGDDRFVGTGRYSDFINSMFKLTQFTLGARWTVGNMFVRGRARVIRNTSTNTFIIATRSFISDTNIFFFVTAIGKSLFIWLLQFFCQCVFKDLRASKYWKKLVHCICIWHIAYLNYCGHEWIES